MKIVFIAYDGILTQSVFESQILKQLELQKSRKNAVCHLVAFENPVVYAKRYSEIAKMEAAIEKKTGINCLFLPRVPGFGGLRLVASMLPHLVRAKGILKKGEKAILHSRGSKGCYIGLKLRESFPGCKVVFDSRSSEPEQYVSDYVSDGRIDVGKLPKGLARLYKELTYFERSSVEGADHIFSQCDELKKSLVAKYGPSEDKFTVFPNAVSLDLFRFDAAQRDAVRKRLGIENRFVLVYCGTVHPYQLPGEGIDFFRRLLKYRPDSFFLALTFSPEQVTEMLERAGVSDKDYSVMKLPYREVPDYMCAGDAGLLFRVQNEYSRTSAPVKLAEYLSTGLFVITLTGIGDATTFVRSRDAGMVLDDTRAETLDEGAKKLASLSRKVMQKDEKLKITELAKGPYSQETQVEEKYRCYQRLLAN